ncbi:MAG: hypothetical protein FJ368_06510, partial [Pelagibacterales bacterium]|nr:hypothetical protein [Pelagibacterales bacterium]
MKLIDKINKEIDQQKKEVELLNRQNKEKRDQLWQEIKILLDTSINKMELKNGKTWYAFDNGDPIGKVERFYISKEKGEFLKIAIGENALSFLQFLKIEDIKIFPGDSCEYFFDNIKTISQIKDKKRQIT